MNQDSAPLSSSRHWRDIPQEVKPRAMSREGRRRLALGLLRWAGGSAAFAVAAWGAWQAAAVWRGGPAAASAGTVPLQHLVLTTDGLLDQRWLERTLALPPNASLAQIDLSRLRARVLASGQAREATIVRDFPATLAVRISERSPIARVMAQGVGASVGVGLGAGARPGAARALLVARDGIVYDGVGYNPVLLESLPWLDGIRLARRDGGFAPIDGMETVADLLNRARLDAEHLYRTWRVVSLERLQSDGEIEVRASDGLQVIFGTQEDFFRQLARLDLLLDTVQARGAGAVSKIDLSLPPQEGQAPAVPVTFAAPSSSPGTRAFMNLHTAKP